MLSGLARGSPAVCAARRGGPGKQARAPVQAPLEGVLGLVFLGFPLHPAGQSGTSRADQLAQVTAPMLFLQSTRDKLADLERLRPIIRKLGARATLRIIEHADHGFDVLKRSGRTREEVLGKLVEAVGEWRETLAS